MATVTFAHKFVSKRCLFCDYTPPTSNQGYPRKDNLVRHIATRHTLDSVLKNGSWICPGEWSRPVPDRNILWFRKPLTSAATHDGEGTIAFCFDCNHYINFTGLKKASTHQSMCERHVCNEKQIRAPKSPREPGAAKSNAPRAAETPRAKWESLDQLGLTPELIILRRDCWMPDDDENPTEAEYEEAYDTFMRQLIQKATKQCVAEANARKHKQAVAHGGGSSTLFGVIDDDGLIRT